MAVEKFGASERFACAVLGQNRSAFRKKKPDMGFEEARLRAALRAVAGQHPRGAGGKRAGTCWPSQSGTVWR
jgi:putative transposase